MSVSVSYLPAIGDDTDAYGFVAGLLEEVSNDFVPPLSQRTRTDEREFSARVDDGFTMYVRQTMAEAGLIAKIDGQYAGFMSFKRHYFEKSLADWCPCNYIVTIAVAEKFRRQGVAEALYGTLSLIPVPVKSEFDVVRTWSTNDRHIGLLDKLAFKEIIRIPNHRAAGIDTVYFARTNG